MNKPFRFFSLAVIIFCYLPIFVLFINSFNSSASGQNWEGFSAKWYKEVFADKDILISLKNSLKIAFVSSTFATILGTMSAVALCLNSANDNFLRWIHRLFLKIIIVLPEVQIGICMMMAFVFLRMELGLLTTILGHTTFCTIYVFDVVSSKLNKFDLRILEAAKDLGANNRDIFFKVIVPMSASAIFAAYIFAFTISIDDFVISFFVSGPESRTLPIDIYGIIKNGSTTILNCISVFMMLFVFCASYIVTRIVFDKNDSKSLNNNSSD